MHHLSSSFGPKGAPNAPPGFNLTAEVTARDLIEVLLVEDNRGDLGLIRAMLAEQSRGNFVLLHADSIGSARRLLGHAQIDVILLDLNLPDTLGPNTVTLMREMAGSVPIVVLTGNDDASSARAATERGAHDYLIKGKFSDDTLAQILINAIETANVERRNSYLARNDWVTALPNRSDFHAHLNDLIAARSSTTEPFALHLIDLRNFSQVNASYGIETGDWLLRHIGERLSRIDGDSYAARVGNDEFVFINTVLEDTDTAYESALRISEQLSQPALMGGNRLDVACSIGTAVFPLDGQSATELLLAANIAVRSAKKNRLPVLMASPYLVSDYNRRVNIRQDLLASLRTHSLDVVFQPIVDLASGRIVSMEALARWEHPEMGRIAPDEFIPIAEHNGMIADVGAQVLRQVGDLLQRTQDKMGGCGVVAINCSAIELESGRILSEILRMTQEKRIAPDRLTIEITETVLIEASRVGPVAEVLTSLQKLGVSIAIDDFGTGYASLRSLRDFPCDMLKIDKSFVSGIEKSAEDREIVRAIIGLGKSLNKQVVAEGVETEAQRSYLMEMGCQLAQGYYFSKPIAAEDVLELDPSQLLPVRD